MNKFKLLCAAAAFAAPSAAYAQETTGTIRGTVVNQGAAVPGAEVAVEFQPTGQTVTATTNEEGAFIFTGLPLGGPFRLTVTPPGAQPVVQEDIFVNAGEPVRVPVDLAAAATPEIVVTGQLQGGGQTLSPTTTLNRDDIEGVATVNRDVRDLIRRSPFAQLDPANVRATSIAGQNPRFNRFSVNGVQFSDDFGLNNGGLPTSRGPVPLDAICQFTVEVAPVDIREGDFQGGAINTNLCQGTNTPTGGAFYTYSDDSLSGDSIDGTPVSLNFRSEAYGAFLRGPIIPDRLFFAFAWERTRESEPLNIGTSDGGFTNGVPGINGALVDRIRGIAQGRLGFDPGIAPQSAPENDDRVTARVDWNINEDHDLSLTYIYNEGTQFVGGGSTTQPGTNAPRLALQSNSYTLAEVVHSGVVQLNSRWSDMFSTEARVSYRDYNRDQTPPVNRDFGEFNICLAENAGGAPTTCQGGPVIRFGPDFSRQANDLNTENLDVQLTANLLVGNHNIRFLAQYTDQDVYNLFLQAASGSFYFDSVQDFINGRAGQLTLAQSTTGDINGAAAIFDYQNFVLGVQDTWDVTDNLTVIAGVRYEWFDQGTPPFLNTFFTNRYGFSNQESLNGRDVILPRFGISWRPMDRLQVRGTFGRYAAGSPDVFISNSYSNTGVNQNRVTINRTATGCTGISGGLCDDALDNVTGGGPDIPLPVRQFVQGNSGAQSVAGVNAIDPEFEVPSQWRAAGTLSYNADLGFLGDNWFFAVDALYGFVEDSIDYIDLRSVQVGTAPDGRPRFAAISGVGASSNSDLLLTNADEGDSLFLVARFDKDFDNGFSIGASYTYADVKERSPVTSSVAFSNYANQGTANPNGSSLGTSNEETTHAVKWNIGYRREFFEGAETRIQLFGEYRTGRPFSYTFDAGQSFGSPFFGRDQVFGVFGNDNRHLIYVPTGLNDPLVTFADTRNSAGVVTQTAAQAQAALDALINGTSLSDFRGQVAGKNVGRSDDYWRVDLHVAQEIPLPARLGKVELFADMENLLNFINDEWGVLRQVGFPYTATIADVRCNPSPADCQRYTYSNVREPNQNTVTNASIWQLRLGVRYEF